MKSIFDIIVGRPILPDRFLSGDYNKFLFFDFFIRNDLLFFDSVQRLSGGAGGVKIFYSHDLRFLGEAQASERWSETIKSIDDGLAYNNEPFGLIVCEESGCWVMAQERLIDLGVFAFNCKSEVASNLFDCIDKDWFLSVGDFECAIANRDVELCGQFGEGFVRSIVENYG
ncbi:hypothetical protein [Burkholderia ubonensis]|uniref:hypothetical protein n=1 Tax=Burkholderia ubonensis TaxID=101571 RepID=UPI0012FA597D|nr:hypothetical protein [Burkholderia ubonensis]